MKVFWSVIGIVVGVMYIVDGVSKAVLNYDLHLSNSAGNVSVGMASVQLALMKIGRWKVE